MKVCIVGISGKFGRYMTQHALDRAYDVTGVCREKSVHKLDPFKGRITVVPGQTDDRDVIERAVAGCDGVLVVLVPWGVHHYATGGAWKVRELATLIVALLSSKASAAAGAPQGCATPEHRRRAERMARQPSQRQSEDCLRDEIGHRKFGIGGLAHVPWDAAPHESHGEVVPVRAAERLDDPGVLSAVGANPVMEGDHERDLASHSSRPVSRSLPDRRFQVVQAVEDAQVRAYSRRASRISSISG